MPYGNVLVNLRVPLRILRGFYLQVLVAPYSYKRPFNLVSFVLLLILVISRFVLILSKLLLDVEYIPLVPSLHYYNAISLPILA